MLPALALSVGLLSPHAVSPRWTTEAPRAEVILASLRPASLPPHLALDLSIEEQVQAPIFRCIRYRENTNSYAWGWPRGTGDGGGAYQFEPQTWVYASQLPGALGGLWGSASPIQQDAAALALSRVQGFGAWISDGCPG